MATSKRELVLNNAFIQWFETWTCTKNTNTLDTHLGFAGKKSEDLSTRECAEENWKHPASADLSNTTQKWTAIKTKKQNENKTWSFPNNIMVHRVLSTQLLGLHVQMTFLKFSTCWSNLIFFNTWCYFFGVELSSDGSHHRHNQRSSTDSLSVCCIAVSSDNHEYQLVCQYFFKMRC